ncbi:MAG: glucoamylase family protein [Elusimicrobiota bacterium]
MIKIRHILPALLLLWVLPRPLHAEATKLIDDFEAKRWVNKLNGTMGAWEKYPFDTAEYCRASFVDEPWNGQPNTALRLLYSAYFYDYNGYFTKLNGFDIRPYQGLVFWAKGGQEFKPVPFKIEIRNNYHTMFYYVESLTKEWQRFTVPFDKFENYSKISDWDEVNEMVFVFEGRKTKPSGGSLFLDDLTLYSSDEYFEKMNAEINDENEAKKKEFEEISHLPEDELLDFIQKKTFDYFWYEASPVTYLVKDRSTLSSSASTGATGFGLTALCIGVERKWITKRQAETRVVKTLEALKDMVAKENGYFYHWVKSHTGRRDGVSEVSSVDTALLIGGVLTVREYFSSRKIRKLADEIFQAIDWPWMFGMDQSSGTLLMGWDPESGFDKYIRWDMFAEEMMMYLLALGSPTHPIPDACWHAFGRPVKDYYGNKYIYHDGESMFVYTYSHAWVDFRNRHDQYADYFKNSQSAIRSNFEFCRNNADKFKTYREGYWGISASDGPRAYAGYGAVYGMHDGTIPPYSLCAAVPFTPDIAIPAIRKLLAEYGPRVWGKYGFVSAFNLDQEWFATEHIGIDEGIILLMIENYRTGFVWKKFMSNPYIQSGMKKAGFRQGEKELDFVYMEELQRNMEKTEEARKMLIGRFSPKIDGDLSDWEGKLTAYDNKGDLEYGEISSKDDLSGSIGMAWDENYIYFAANVTDDKLMATENPAEIYRGDCIELYLDTKTKGKNFAWGDQEYFQIGLAPGCALGRPIAYAWFQNGEQSNSIRIQSNKTEKGYTLEVAIKADFLRMRPELGNEIGMSAALHDLDKTEGGDKKLNWWFKKSAGRIQLGMVKLAE